ncbi:MAG: zinc-ribbon domain-containing protein [Planctomycetes bacterium]|nr:zinc-ribbon domain-containing protein [Planctomycetota bacterium]
MSDTIKHACPQCGAKYRLPVEAQGRTAKCKKCGNKFRVPQRETIEDSILDWLNEPEPDEETVAQPRVISMPAKAADESAAQKVRGPIRLKSGSAETH